MINSFSDMLQEIKNKEEDIISDLKLNHPTIIGDAYEGIAEKILNKSIFEGLDLKVVSGQITNEKGERSHQIDCMIVEGEGLNISNTKHYIYDIKQVIAVIEVKKNLNGSDLRDSYHKMQRISQIYEPQDTSEGEYRLFRDAFKSATGYEPPEHKEAKNLNLIDEMMYHSLLLESVMPLRIVFGFYGYKSMTGLRNGMVQFLKDNVTSDLNKRIKGFGPVDFPSMIFTRNSALIKINGIPYMPRIDREGYWDFYTSMNQNPLYILLELLWTKLSYKYSIDSSVFGEDLTIESHFGFLRCKPIKIENQTGYHFTEIKLPKDSDEETLFIDWQPVELNEPEFIVITWLCKNNVLSREKLKKLTSEFKINEDKFLARLNEERLVYVDTDGKIRLLTKECAVIFKNGKAYAGENNSGRMTRWALK